MDIQAAILSEISDGWVSAREIADKYKQWSPGFIAQQLRFFLRHDLIFRRFDVRPGGALTARYTRKRLPAEIGNPLIGTASRPRCPHCMRDVVLSDPPEAFCADPA